ncbi:conserved hypothetical protein [Altererythrobacter sp. B11]|uniref:division/cell wall cluster transcriptional repressor MraZ n=1 Tax=Altererythrobacter sp. B11 TaxID=2060312 RepID=UPI000DC70C25|nr:division/cell wall cluster transcriptional repressor MraZ [Altererythrobacter sp. B11]BBC74128.1 conserved hypothetical protein [Altererythrobacter sp. B11]
MAKGPAGYSGQGFSLRGEKGRYVLPPSFRKAIAPTEDDPRVLCLAKHNRWDCLTGFGLSRTEDFDAQIDREEEAALRRGEEFDRDMRSMQLWTFSEIPFDASGRFVLPDALGGLVGMTGSIAFLGGSPFFSLWAPDALYEMDQKWFGQQQAVCRQQEAEATAKAKRK